MSNSAALEKERRPICSDRVEVPRVGGRGSEDRVCLSKVEGRDALA